jgi:hypothetical protein
MIHSIRQLAGFPLIVIAILSPMALAGQLQVINNQPFPVRMPWTLRDGTTVLLDVPANGKQTIDPLQDPPPPGKNDRLTARIEGDGVHLLRGGRDLGTLAWDILLEKLKTTPTDAEAGGNQRDFAALFHPIPLEPLPARPSPLFTTFPLEGSRSGLKLHLDLDAYPAGFVDLHATFTNESAPTKDMYCAVITRWTRPKVQATSVDYDNHIAQLSDGGSTPFRAGEGRHLFIQRGVDWINTQLADGTSIAWLNAFAPSFTVHHDATAKRPARWVGANTAQLGQEAILNADALYSITEIARPNIKMYASRLDDNVLPGADQPLKFTSRVIITDQKLTDARVDQLFVAYTGYNSESSSGPPAQPSPGVPEEGESDKLSPQSSVLGTQSSALSPASLSLGVPHVRFGTAYFPYSTLGENFEAWHMPGQSQETYWPLSADTVTHYKLFADEIRRDLRIIKAMGFQSVRLHHLEMLASLPKQVQDDYLEFLFSELKHVGLTALLDVKLPPARIAELVKKYRTQIDGVELDNEILIFGIDDDEVQWFKDAYAAVKSVAPEIPVWLTGHTNTGAFDRLSQLGVSFDKLGQHAYMDSLDAIASGRDYALAFASYGSRVGKPPIITEWNWRFLTRMTPENRAKVYPPIFENVLKTRSVPTIYQFQLQESLAMASHTLRGIRHYELLNLSRRPRPEALEFMKLIRQYGDPAAPEQAIRTGYEATEMHAGMHGEVHLGIHMTNTTSRPRHVMLSAEGPDGIDVTIRGQKEYDLQPNQRQTAELVANIPQSALPGFYHVFARIDGGDAGVTYAWQEIQKPGAPRIDKQQGVHPEVHYANGALDYDFNRKLAVVYGTHASGWEVESAWLLYQTLESATGRPVKIFQMNDLPDELKTRGNLIVVGTPSTNEMIAPAKAKAWITHLPANETRGDRLIVAGDNEKDLNLAAIDLTLRYWKYARDAGMRRIPLTDRPIVKGADPNALP